MRSFGDGLEKIVAGLSAVKGKLALAAAAALVTVSCGPPMASMDWTVDNPFNRPVPKDTVQGAVIAERSLSYQGSVPTYNFAVQEPDGRCYGFVTERDVSLDSRIDAGSKVTVKLQSPVSPQPYDYCINFHYANKVIPSQVEVAK